MLKISFPDAVTLAAVGLLESMMTALVGQSVINVKSRGRLSALVAGLFLLI